MPGFAILWFLIQLLAVPLPPKPASAGPPPGGQAGRLP
jgi:hypothetical protein